MRPIGGAERFGRIRLFEDERLERLTFTPPLLFAAIWTPVLAVALFAVIESSHGLVATVALILAGLLGWSLFEYGAHRFLFHLEPRSAVGRRLIFLVHENHHVDPGDRLRNLMPPGVSLSLAGLSWLAFRAAAGPGGNALFLGFASGYVCYDLVHYGCHQWRLPGALGRRLKQHHLRHHHAGLGANYAITGIFWDKVFGTTLRRTRTGRAG